jgi:DNA-binding transcriptional LysR family regulator
MELRHLRYFVAVAEELHFGRAAQRLGISQPPLSQQIKALEREMGVLLLRRLPRGVAPTEAGRSFLASAKAILAGLEEAVAAARRTARGEEGRIALGFTSSAPFHPFVPRVLRAFREAAPLVELALEESGTTELIVALRGQRIDAAFIRTPVAEPAGLALDHLLDEPMLVALPAAHPLAGPDDAPLPLAALAAETFLVYRRPAGPGLYDAIIAACHAAGFSPIIGQEAPRITATLNLVAAGLGLSLVPASLSRMRLDGVAFRRLADAGAPSAPLLLASRRADPSPTLRRFLALARRAAGAGADPGRPGTA